MTDTRPLAQLLACFASASSTDGIPTAVADSVRQRVLDILGLCVAAYRLPTSHGAAAYVREQGGTGRATGVGMPEPLPTSQAAFLNGVLAHSLDYDDTHLPSVLHPSASVIPAALAVAESTQVSGERLVSAIAVGLEVAVRLGMAGYDSELGNSVFFEHGQHATSICGAMGGAAAAALLLDLGPEGVQNALGITGSFAAGIIEANRTGGTVKRLHCGWAAQSAVSAAQLVQHGFSGPPTVLEGRFGFFEAFLRSQADLEQVTQGLGERWAVPDIFFKPYPANHFTHTAVDAGRRLRERGVPLTEIHRIRLGVPSAVIRTIGEPIELKRAPETGYQAQFSGPFAVATGLLGGSGLGAGLADYTDEKAQEPQRRALMALVDVEADARCDAVFPMQFPAIVTVRTADGCEYTEEVLVNRGGPQDPLSETELAIKFNENVAGRLDPTRADLVRERVLRLTEVSDVAEALEPLRHLIDVPR